MGIARKTYRSEDTRSKHACPSRGPAVRNSALCERSIGDKHCRRLVSVGSVDYDLGGASRSANFSRLGAVRAMNAPAPSEWRPPAVLRRSSHRHSGACEIDELSREGAQRRRASAGLFGSEAIAYVKSRRIAGLKDTGRSRGDDNVDGCSGVGWTCFSLRKPSRRWYREEREPTVDWRRRK